jgi:hypothetical protein
MSYFSRFSVLASLTGAALLIPTQMIGQVAQNRVDAVPLPLVASGVVGGAEQIPDAPAPEIASSSFGISADDDGSGQTVNPPGPQAEAQPGTPQGSGRQTKRILFIVPNFRSVSADQKLPPMTFKDKGKLFLSDTFDYSGFIEVGLLAGSSDWHRSEPEFGHGMAAYGRYYWHGLADTTDANLWTEFLVPVVAREDPRFYTLGHGGKWKRSVYSVSRLLITRSDSGHETVNLAEIVGNGTAAGISNFYYPRNDRTWTKTGQRWVLQVGIDGVSNVVKEFWPDINDHLFHNKY